MSIIRFNVILLEFVVYFWKSAYTTEPHCSRFENDKRIMEYMIETRYELKDLAKDLIRTEETLLTILDEHKTDIAQLEEGMLNLTDRFNSLQETRGRQTVAFSAFNPFDKSLQTKEIFILQSVLINEGNGYDTKSGIFTAPFSGLYHFTAHVCNAHGLVIHYAIVKDGDWIAGSQQFEQASENSHKYASCSSVNALTRMRKGNQVWIMCTSGYSSSTKQIHDDQYRRNSFIGVLLHK